MINSRGRVCTLAAAQIARKGARRRILLLLDVLVSFVTGDESCSLEISPNTVCFKLQESPLRDASAKKNGFLHHPGHTSFIISLFFFFVIIPYLVLKVSGPE